MFVIYYEYIIIRWIDDGERDIKINDKVNGVKFNLYYLVGRYMVVYCIEILIFLCVWKFNKMREKCLKGIFENIFILWLGLFLFYFYYLIGNVFLGKLVL